MNTNNGLRTREARRGCVQTVLGLIEPIALARTLMHEHILCDIRPPSWKTLGSFGREITLENRYAIDYGEVTAPGNLVLDDRNTAIQELRRFRTDGGNSIVELSCGGLHPDPNGLVEVARGSDVHIVMGCGYYVDEYQDPANQSRSVDNFATEMLEQIERGAWGTDVRAGILGEIGCQTPWTGLERRVMAAAAEVQRDSGAAVCVHPARHPDQPFEAATFLEQQGADLSRVIMSHLDRTIFDDERLFRLADTGVVLEFDLFGIETSFYKWADIDMPNDAQRLRTLRRLIDRGHLEQIAISQDICYKTRLVCHGGHGYGHILRNVVPMMMRRGFSSEEIATILEHTPQRLLALV